MTAGMSLNKDFSKVELTGKNVVLLQNTHIGFPLHNKNILKRRILLFIYICNFSFIYY